MRGWTESGEKVRKEGNREEGGGWGKRRSESSSLLCETAQWRREVERHIVRLVSD